MSQPLPNPTHPTDLDRVRELIDAIAEIVETVETPNTGKRGRPARGKFSSSAQRFNEIMQQAGIEFRIDQRALQQIYSGRSGSAMVGFVRYVLEQSIRQITQV